MPGKLSVTTFPVPVSFFHVPHCYPLYRPISSGGGSSSRIAGSASRCWRTVVTRSARNVESKNEISHSGPIDRAANTQLHLCKAVSRMQGMRCSCESSVCRRCRHTDQLELSQYAR